MKYLVALLAALLTGCAGLDSTIVGPIADVVGTAVGKDEATVKSGMTSRDAAYVTTYKAYVNANKVENQKPLLKLEAVPGKAIENLHSVEVYAPPSNGQAKLDAPKPPKGAVVELIDSIGGAVAQIGRLVWLPWALADKAADVTKHLNDNDVKQEQIRSDERRDFGGRALDAATKDPVVIETTPAPVQ